jgi:hypothetical protein
MELSFRLSNLATRENIELHLAPEAFDSNNDLKLDLNVTGDRMDAMHIIVPSQYLQIAPEFVSGWLRINGYSPTTRVDLNGMVIIEFERLTLDALTLVVA